MSDLRTVRETREAAGHTQAEAAAVIEVARRTWQDYESGRRSMPPGLLRLYRILTWQEPVPRRPRAVPRPPETTPPAAPDR